MCYNWVRIQFQRHWHGCSIYVACCQIISSAYFFIVQTGQPNFLRPLQQIINSFPILNRTQCNLPSVHAGRVQESMLCAGSLSTMPVGVCRVSPFTFILVLIHLNPILFRAVWEHLSSSRTSWPAFYHSAWAVEPTINRLSSHKCDSSLDGWQRHSLVLMWLRLEPKLERFHHEFGILIQLSLN